MASAAASRANLGASAGSASASGSGGTGAGAGPSTAPSSSSSNPAKRSSSTTAQQPQVSLLGTLPLHLVPALLHRIETSLATLPPALLCEKETVLARLDDETSGVRETGDNAWASVVKARKGVKLRVRESLNRIYLEGVESESVECTLFLPFPSLPERQYPKASLRPSYNVQLLSDTPIPPGHSVAQRDPFAAEGGDTFPGFDPNIWLDTDLINGWKSFVSSIGWRPHFTLLRYGLTFALNETLSRQSSTASPNPLNPSQRTKHTLNMYRIFTPDPTSYTDDWVPLDPEGATVVIELTALVGGEMDQSHFNQYCTPEEVGPAQTAGGLHPNSTIQNAIDFAESVAKSLRGLVDLRREPHD
ncbi:hypothetical protein NDA11_001808 [Ustilago hordei]|nr:hypothetical protein NDA15_006557 [Ustilago hordei]KAJ1579263.1 hypothetical protein NDA11_001808 [Ustilago hordei]KAJ1579673.1 hypothetical protein NDA12_004252 [Ustilago hordei]KAJ1598662.1 hypothetical protein NDA14_006296 [Ustilago hordei]UTT90947.1 hypothetical protein NDA17_005248 [Ustilago hordei]